MRDVTEKETFSVTSSEKFFRPYLSRTYPLPTPALSLPILYTEIERGALHRKAPDGKILARIHRQFGVTAHRRP